MSQAAIDIYQGFLDVSTRLVRTGDAIRYVDHIRLPFVLRTAQGAEVIETAVDMINDIGKMHRWLTENHVSDYHRIARSARFLDAETIEGFHVTYALRGAVPVVEPYNSRVLLSHDRGVWKCPYAEHELADVLYPGRDSRARHGIFRSEWRGSDDGHALDQNAALPIYAATVSNISDVVSTGGVDAWHDLYTSPYSVHYDEGDYRVETLAAGRRFYDVLHGQMAELGADRVTVAPTSATFLSEDRLLGYHEARLTRDGQTLFGPVQSRMVLVEKDGRWLCTSVANALSTSGFARGAFVPSEKFPTLREIQTRMKK